MTELILLIAAAGYVAAQFAIALALRRKLGALRANARRAEPLRVYPGISVLTSLKGPTPGAAEAVRSLLLQDYPGEVEITFAAKDAREPLLNEIREVCARTPHRFQIKWVYPVDVEGLNPRTAKIARACAASSQPWIFGTTVDTRFDPGFLRRAMQAAGANAKTFVTSFPAIDRPAQFAAALETAWLNVDVSQYFLLSSALGRPCAYGGAMLFSRELLDSVGGYESVLRLLSDDVTLASAFGRAGATCRLAPDVAWVAQERHDLREFWTRQIRWRMIAKYFLPELFWMSPLAWNNVLLAAGAALLHSAPMAWALAGLTVARAGQGIATQAILGAPKQDWLKGAALPICDWVQPAATVAALCKRSVRWGTTVMRLDSKGAVSATAGIGADVRGLPATGARA